MGEKLDRFLNFFGGERRKKKKRRKEQIKTVKKVLRVIDMVEEKVEGAGKFLAEGEGPLGLGVLPRFFRK